MDQAPQHQYFQMKTSILKIVESPGEFGLQIKGVEEAVEYEVKKELFK